LARKNSILTYINAFCICFLTPISALHCHSEQNFSPFLLVSSSFYHHLSLCWCHCLGCMMNKMMSFLHASNHLLRIHYLAPLYTFFWLQASLNFYFLAPFQPFYFVPNLWLPLPFLSIVSSSTSM
jgi:hypothetical protein